ncbi:FecR family protein [Pedobacter sp. GR22-6]|uniref:FecR family protein n=1 Tax=Pedobacter sp. GR22-6 TaxID=3127957 RepID=UPI00307F3D18
MDNESVKQLIAKYQDGTATKEERLIVDEWYNHITKAELKQAVDHDMSSAKAAIWSRLSLELKQPPASKSLYSYLAAVAAAVAFIVIGVYFFNAPEIGQDNGSQIAKKEEIIPGKVGATLTLANGKKIRLADVAKGQLAKEAGVVITKSENGQLIYHIEGNGSEIGHVNTLSTARGETYQIHLPDGSLVYLNAASSLTYNTSLIENGKRVVKLSGEGYFEIAKDKVHPFIVKTDKEDVEVLGTHFNINSYVDDDVTKTTLLEGSVKLSAFGLTRILKPGQQARLGVGKIRIAEVDTDVAVAWKNNEFVVESEPIENIMKMVERWYNVEVIYVGPQTNERFSGGVSRFDKISKVLDIVESTGEAHFEIKGRKIYVSK